MTKRTLLESKGGKKPVLHFPPRDALLNSFKAIVELESCSTSGFTCHNVQFQLYFLQLGVFLVITLINNIYCIYKTA